MRPELALAPSVSASPDGRVRPQGIVWRDFGPTQRAGLRNLIAHASQPNPFYEDWHLFPSLEALDPHGHVIIWYLEDAEGAPLGLIPLQRQATYYGRPLPHWRNWMHANCFLGAPLVRKGSEAQFWGELFEWLDGAASLPIFLHLAGLPLDTALAAALDTCLAGSARRGRRVHIEERAMLRSSLAPQEYLEDVLSTKRRKELRRQRRRLEELGAVETQYQHDGRGLNRWIESFLLIEAAGWKGNKGTAAANDAAKTAILTKALHGAAACGRLERRALLLDGEPIAMLASFRTPPGAFSYKTAFREDYARFSPGVLLQVENLDSLADPGIDWVDSCACEDHPMIDHMWRERRRIARYSVGIGGSARQALFRAVLAAEGRAE